MLTAIEMWLVEKLLSTASGPDEKKWVLAKLKDFDTATTNPLLKALIEAAELFLAEPAV